MIAQVNLLPSVKEEHLKAQHFRRLVISGALVVVVVAIAVPILLVLVSSGQKLVLNRTQDSINKDIQTINSTPDISTILSIKDRLASLPALYQNRVRMSQFFKVLPSVTPQQLKLTSLDASADGTFSFSGTAPNYKLVDSFFTALSQAKVAVDPNKVDPDPNATGRFTHLSLENVGGVSGAEVSFTIRGQFDLTLVSGGVNNGQN